MRIYLAADHGGFELKEHVKEYLLGKGVQVVDIGNTSLDQEDDYPEEENPILQNTAARP